MGRRGSCSRTRDAEAAKARAKAKAAKQASERELNRIERDLLSAEALAAVQAVRAVDWLDLRTSCSDVRRAIKALRGVDWQGLQDELRA